MIKNILLIITICLLLIICLLTISIYKQEKIGSTDINDGIRIMSFNITVNDPEHAWVARRDYVIVDINKIQPDIIGFQEVSPTQYNWLKKKLKGYNSVITYRDNNKSSEACPVFYSISKFRLIESNTFWLSKTPSIMSTAWDAEYYRICTCVILERLSDSKKIALYNTHLDNSSEEARKNGIQVVLDKIANNKKLPTIVTGDFNDTVESETYQIISSNLIDTCIAATISDDGATFQDWGKNLNIPRIDYIFVSNHFLIEKFKIVNNTYDTKCASDHFAIYTEIYFS